jgi:iron complex outermembrane receptor protein
VPEKWKFMLGTKVEHNSITGFEAQPNARVLWTPSPDHSVWAAVSHAVRIPSRGERDSRVDLLAFPRVQDTPFGPVEVPVLVRAEPNPDLDSEKLTAYEAGYRGQLTQGLSLDLALFFNRYKDLRAGLTLTPVPGPVIVAPLRTANSLKADTRGLELAVDWHVQPWWRLHGAYTYFDMNASRIGDPATDDAAVKFEGSTPRSQVSLRSSMNLGKSQQFDVWVRRVGKLPAVGVDAYTAVDLRYAWKLTKDLEISVVGQNLFDPRHVEGVVDFLPAQTMEIERAAFVKATWRF